MKRLMVLLLATALVSFGMFGVSSEAEAQKSSSGSPPASSGSTGSKPSFSGGTTTPPPASKPSFSGGTTTPPPASKPSFSGGTTTPPPASKTPPSGNTPPPASKPSFSGGGTTTPPASKPSFSGGGNNTSGNKTEGSRPVSNGYDSKAGQAQAKQESKQAMKKAEAPKTEYKTPNGTVKSIDPKDKKIEQLRNELDHEKWVNRSSRQEIVYHNYYGRPPMIYSDPYGPLFMYVLLDRSLDERAAWAYHHQDSMDAARYRDLLAKDAQLEARVRKMEAEKVQRDPAYSLPGLDPDLQYDDDFVDAAYNAEHPPSSFELLGWVCLWTFMGVAIIAIILYLVFVKEWK